MRDPPRSTAPLLALRHHTRSPLAFAQTEAGSKTGESRHFHLLLKDLDQARWVITCDTLHTIKGHLAWLMKDKEAHYAAVIKTNQLTLHARISPCPGDEVPIAHSVSEVGHGLRGIRLLNTAAVAESVSDRSASI